MRLVSALKGLKDDMILWDLSGQAVRVDQINPYAFARIADWDTAVVVNYDGIRYKAPNRDGLYLYRFFPDRCV